jgi:phosphotriesterase-related protein
MTTVPAVRGPIDSSELGATLMHEHIFVLTSDIILNYPGILGDEDQRVEQAAARLNQLAAQGVRTIVDLTVIGQGRFIPRIQRVAEQTSINIIAATGLYTFSDVPFYFRIRGARREPESVDPMTDMFVRDITTGIGDTAVRAGILKCATDAAGLTRGVERVLRAVAQAHRATGVPISTHTHGGTKRGLDQQRYLRAATDSPERRITSSQPPRAYRATAAISRQSEPRTNTVRSGGPSIAMLSSPETSGG